MSRGREQFELIPNTSTWEERVELYDDESGEGIDLVVDLVNIVVSLRDEWTKQVVLTGDIASGNVAVLSATAGVFRFLFPVEQMQGLCPNTYELGVRLLLLDEVNQVILGRVSVVQGL